MLKIENFQNIEGKEFQLSNGKKYVIGIARQYLNHYSFGVFELDERNIANITNALIFELSNEIFDGGDYAGYWLACEKMKRIARVKPENLTLRNFVLELQIQTAMIVNNR